MGGISFEQSVTIRASDSVLSAGSATLSVSSGKTVSTENHVLTITADDFDIKGAINSGLVHINIECSTPGRTVSIGESLGQQFSISPGEFGRLAATGMTIGGANCARAGSTGL